jgi:hypothetical protein
MCVAELQNPQEERFAQLLAVGVDQAVAYQRAGWVKDKANASKRAKLPSIIERVAELRAEEAARVAKLRMEAGDLPGADELKRALQGAAASGQWAAAVTASKALAELDGSGAALAPDRPRTVDELVSEVSRHGPTAALAARMIAIHDSFDVPPPPNADIDTVIAGLGNWFTETQLKELAARLLSRR